MNYFVEINDLPVLDLKSELNDMLSNNIINFNQMTSQICLNTIVGKENDYEFGRGSLYYDWENKTIDAEGNYHVPIRDKILKETDFNILCNQFNSTKFEKVYDALNEKYFLGRVRIMKLLPKTCLSWHVDEHPRIHFPIQTYEGCFMIIEDELKHLQESKWYYTHTIAKHTAINSSNNSRYHLVATIIGEK